MTIDQYFHSLSIEMNHQSERVRSCFSAHKPTSGTNREGIVASFLKANLPGAIGVESGLIVSRQGEFSNEADIVVYDHLHNSPLNTDMRSKLFIVESIWALFEIKTQLSPRDLQDAISKCRRFKELDRQYLDGELTPKIKESLFVIFSFESPKPETLKSNFAEAIANVPMPERPDFLIVPGSIVATSGHYFEISKLGQANSPHRRMLEQKGAAAVDAKLGDGFQFLDMGDHALMTFFIWFSSWLQHAGSRASALQSYLAPDRVWGRRI